MYDRNLKGEEEYFDLSFMQVKKNLSLNQKFSVKKKKRNSDKISLFTESRREN